jgi:hypothetical protein
MMSSIIRPTVRIRLRRSDADSGAPVCGCRAADTAARYGSMCCCRSRPASEAGCGSVAVRNRPKCASRPAMPETVERVRVPPQHSRYATSERAMPGLTPVKWRGQSQPSRVEAFAAGVTTPPRW